MASTISSDDPTPSPVLLPLIMLQNPAQQQLIREHRFTALNKVNMTRYRAVLLLFLLLS